MNEAEAMETVLDTTEFQMHLHHLEQYQNALHWLERYGKSKETKIVGELCMTSEIGGSESALWVMSQVLQKQTNQDAVVNEAIDLCRSEIQRLRKVIKEEAEKL